MRSSICKTIAFLLIMILWFSAGTGIYAAGCEAGQHEYEVQIVTPADGERAGLRKYICIYCGYSYAETIPSTGHHFSEYYVEQEAACNSEGFLTRVCMDCGKEDYLILPMTGQHQFGGWEITKQPGCITAGSRQQVCRDCGYVEREEVGALGEHKYEIEVRAAACTEAGETIYTCTICRDTYSEAIEPLRHQYGEAVIIKEATENEEGLRVRLCEHDHSHVLEEAIPKLVVRSQADRPAGPAGQSLHKKGPFNWLDGVFSMINMGTFTVLFIVILRDYQVIRWDRNQKRQLEKRRELV